MTDDSILLETDSFERASGYAKHVATVSGCEVDLKKKSHSDGSSTWSVCGPSSLKQDFYKHPEFIEKDEEESDPIDQIAKGIAACPHCNGSGEGITGTCGYCEGDGEVLDYDM